MGSWIPASKSIDNRYIDTNTYVARSRCFAYHVRARVEPRLIEKHFANSLRFTTKNLTLSLYMNLVTTTEFIAQLQNCTLRSKNRKSLISLQLYESSEI